MKRFGVIGLLLAVVGSGMTAVAAEPEGGDAAAGVVAPLPELDIVGNVRRMLDDASTAPGHAEVAADTMETSDGAAPQERHMPPEPAAHAAPAPTQQLAAPVAPETRPTAVAPTPAPSAAATTSNHVPLPEKEITIRSLDDLRALSQELDKAKAKARR